jgi:hypothetical protein
MQTALDKVDQELAMQQAKGQSLTRAAETTETLRAVWRQVNRSSWLPYVVATGVTLVILVVVALILTGGSGGQSSEPTSTTAPTQVVSALTEEATASQIPPTDTTIPPTDTSVPPSETTVQPTSTPESPTATSVPPSETPVPPTPEPPTPIPPTPVPPTPLPVIPTDVPAGATAAPSDWLPVSFVYNNNGFWWLNGASRSISSQPIAFERIGGTGSFTGNRWAYWTMEPGRCMEIRFTDVSNPQRPNGCRPNAFFTPTRTQGIDFWTGSGQFRVLWNGAEIAVCEIAAGQCNAAVPPA